jgi:hypothetical protein
MEGLQLLKTFDTDFEAELVKQKLAEAGIECFAQSSDSDNMLPNTEGVGIYVEPYDFEKAMWLVTNSKDDLTDEMEVGGGD